MGSGSLLVLSEREWMYQLQDLAKLYGWAVYHPWLSVHSARGWPDLALCRPPRLILAELKTDKGKLTPAQDQWIGMLQQCDGVEAYVWRPSMFDDVVGVLR